MTLTKPPTAMYKPHQKPTALRFSQTITTSPPEPTPLTNKTPQKVDGSKSSPITPAVASKKTRKRDSLFGRRSKFTATALQQTWLLRLQITTWWANDVSARSPNETSLIFAFGIGVRYLYGWNFGYIYTGGFIARRWPRRTFPLTFPRTIRRVYETRRALRLHLGTLTLHRIVNYLFE